jgi:four helix bundle protein
MQISKYSNNQMIDIHDRIYEFVVAVVKLTKELSKNPQNDVIVYQLMKSATSMGANDQEADGTQSRKDFIAKYSIVKKETKETNYWLNLLGEINSDYDLKLKKLKQEGLEILKIVSAIIINAKKGLK